ncbi:carbonic anhydrase 2-like isoform X1 [Carex rostrata]
MTKEKELSALEQLKYGFDHFKKEVYEKDIKRFEQLAEEQKPKFLVIACADSRVCPSTIFSFQPGEAFTVRNIAALVPPFCEKKRNSGVGAALEYAIEILKVENIVVVGHSRCGGVRGLMSIPEDSHNCDDFIEDWVKIGWSARERVKDEHGTLPLSDQCSYCEKVSYSFHQSFSHHFQISFWISCILFFICNLMFKEYHCKGFHLRFLYAVLWRCHGKGDIKTSSSSFIS